MWLVGEDGLLLPLLVDDGARFVLGVWMVCQLCGAGTDRALQEQLMHTHKYIHT